MIIERRKKLIKVPLYTNAIPCKCTDNCSYSKTYEDTGSPEYIKYVYYNKKDFGLMSIND